jgi:hypothetical protein
MLLSYLFAGGLGRRRGFAQFRQGRGRGRRATSGALKGLSLAALLSAPYSKPGQKVIQKALLGDRPRSIANLGDFPYQ